MPQSADAIKSKPAIVVMHVTPIRIKTEWRVKIGIASALRIASGFRVPNDRKSVGGDANNFAGYRI